MDSFSKKVKRELCQINSKMKNCCTYSYLYGLMFCSIINDDNYEIKMLNSDVGQNFLSICQQLNTRSLNWFSYNKNKIVISTQFFRANGYYEIKKNVLKCQRCKESFLKGIFLSIGTVSDPYKSYRLELIFNEKSQADQISELLCELGIDSLRAVRFNKHILYLRKSEAIEDFFANIGATSFAFDIMNSKINKELINNANRVTNCDSANINKALSASNKYNTVINRLIKTKNISLLPSHLQEMALKRIEFKELSFSELGKQFAPSISKSGVHHRLEKILEFYEELKEKKLI